MDPLSVRLRNACLKPYLVGPATQRGGSVKILPSKKKKAGFGMTHGIAPPKPADPPTRGVTPVMLAGTKPLSALRYPSRLLFHPLPVTHNIAAQTEIGQHLCKSLFIKWLPRN